MNEWMNEWTSWGTIYIEQTYGRKRDESQEDCS